MGSVASKLSPQQADGFFYEGDMKIREKGKFFVNRSVLAPKNFPIENFRVRSDLQKISLFHEFSCRFGKKNRRPAADSILMPPTFHIPRLNRYTPNFSGVH